MNHKTRTKEMTAKTDITPTTAPFVNNTLPESIMTISSASRLFRKCANIATRTLPVFKYRIAMQTPKMNAEVMLP